jgi:hypothetical protein
MADHWRDQHRTGGKFKPRPNARGFAPNDPPAAKGDTPRERRPFALWVERTGRDRPNEP